MQNALEFVFYAVCMLSPVAARQIRPRVVGGIPDDEYEFPFAVMLQFATPPMARTCSGSLITPTWVLTAGHCTPPNVDIIKNIIRVKYGDTTIPSNETKFFSIIIKTVHHPSFKHINKRLYNDIGLMKIERIRNTPITKLSGTDYLAWMGLPVKYAGFGRTKLLLKGEKVPKTVDVINDLEPALRMGEAVVISCKQNGGMMYGRPNICIAPRCGPHQQPYFGDSGGPLVYDGRLIGVCSGATDDSFALRVPLVAYTPVSPYLDWIYDTIHSDKENI
ncbi:putative trypsin-6 [Choristoneura fumiferana]|uniref:putative trypsin-6 n=1 Tax=Choristoneura fumiferana TaxID=7141 RepID=UPI003D157E09